MAESFPLLSSTNVQFVQLCQEFWSSQETALIASCSKSLEIVWIRFTPSHNWKLFFHLKCSLSAVAFATSGGDQHPATRTSFFSISKTSSWFLRLWKAKYTSGHDVLHCWVWHCHVHCAFNTRVKWLSNTWPSWPFLAVMGPTARAQELPHLFRFLSRRLFSKFPLLNSALSFKYWQQVTWKWTFFPLRFEIWNSVERVRRDHSRSCTNSVISTEMPQQNITLLLISFLAGTCPEIDCRNTGEIVSPRMGRGCPSTIPPCMFTLHYFSSSKNFTRNILCYYQHLDEITASVASSAKERLSTLYLRSILVWW